MATKRNTKKKEVDTSTSDLVADLMGDRLVASHILNGCQVMICVETGSLSYVCVSRCTSEKQPKNSQCSPLQDTHISIRSLARKSKFTKLEKKALDYFASPF